jgi:uncharacterized protein YbjT (DUF2867 family)
MPGKTAIVVGATGLVGSLVLQALLASKDYDRVLAVVRRPVLSPHPKLVVLETPFDQLDTALADVKANEAYCCLGTTIRQAGTKAEFHKVDYGYAYTFAHRMRQNGTRHFLLVSALGAAASSPVFYNRVKGRLEKDIEALGFKQLSIFRPSLLLGSRQDSRLMESLTARLAPLIRPFLIGGLSKIHPIPGSTVANAMVGAARARQEGTTLYYFDDMQTLAAPAGEDTP